MAKGRTNQPLVIWVDRQYVEHEKIAALREQGHKVIDIAPPGPGEQPDLILHPAAHFWNDMMWDFLPAALTAARKRKREAGR